MNAIQVVSTLLEAPMRTLRDLRQQPADQVYLCSDASVAERHRLAVPFKCGCRQWISAGTVKIEFYSNRDEYATGHRLQDADYARIDTLQPVPGEKWTFDEVHW